MQKLLNLKLAFLEKGTNARAVSKKTGIPESYISMAVNGRYNLTEEQKTKISKELGKSKSALFGAA